MTPETLAEAILHASGSGLRHYTPQSRSKILEAAQAIITAMTNEIVGKIVDTSR